MKKLISNFKKKVAVVLTMALSLVAIGGYGNTTNVYAASTPSFGSGAPSSITLYVNDRNTDSRAVNIRINNWKSGYSYKAYSSNNNVAKVVNGSVNSKSGVLFSVQAKGLGNTTVKVQICKGSKVISTKNIKVYVKARTLPTPTGLKLVSKTKNSIKVSFKVSSTSYVNGSYIQISTSPRFTSGVKSYKTASIGKTTAVEINNLAPGTRYYVRVKRVSTLNNYALFSNWSPGLSVSTNWR